MAAVEKQSDHCQDSECARSPVKKGHLESDLRVTKVSSKGEDVNEVASGN